MKEELNEEIKDIETNILTRENAYNEALRQLDIAKYVFKANLDKKEYSNEEKREMAAITDHVIAKQIYDIREFKYKLDLLKIELNYKLREFEIKKVILI